MTYAPILLDLLAIGVLTFGLYLPRHRRRDLVVAIVGINGGVLAVAMALSAGTIDAGLGLGLFGVLSIIRLRSAELSQEEIAYYFAALALGLVAGLGSQDLVLTAALMAALLAAIAIADSRRLQAGLRREDLLVDRAFTDETALVAHLEGLLGAHVHRVQVRRVDLVNDTTLVEVRYELPKAGRGPAHDGPAATDADAWRLPAAAATTGARR